MRSIASQGRPWLRRTRDGRTVSFAREGLPFIVIAALVAAGTYALALNRRSWPLWLLAFALTITALGVAYFYREPAGPGDDQTASAAIDAALSLLPGTVMPAPWHGRTGTHSFVMNESNLPVDRFPVSGR